MPDRGKRLERLQVMLDEDEMAAVDSWRFKAHMPSRSAAIRELLKRGLTAEGHFDEATFGSRSGLFGVLDNDKENS